MIHFTVGPLSRPTSLLGALRHFGVSSTLRRRIKRKGVCTVNGSPASTTQFVYEGDVVCVDLPQVNSFSPEPIPLSIAYEDDYLLVVDKPAGLLMHPTAAVRQGTLANAVAYYYEQSRQRCSYHPMHRLDKNTSGLCMIAKEPQVQSQFDKKRNILQTAVHGVDRRPFSQPLRHRPQPYRPLPGQHHYPSGHGRRKTGPYGFHLSGRRRRLQPGQRLPAHGPDSSDPRTQRLSRVPSCRRRPVRRLANHHDAAGTARLRHAVCPSHDGTAYFCQFPPPC